MHRDTYVEINTDNLTKNVQTIIKKYNNYKYYIGVVKANSYSHYGIKPVQAIIKGGCNFLAVATLDEALEIREKIKNVPILCFGIIDHQYLDLCIENNISITISSLDYLKRMRFNKDFKLKVHLKINTGMNRLGLTEEKDIQESINIISNSSLIFEGIYTHIYHAKNKKDTIKQLKLFNKHLENINVNIPIIHIGGSEAVTNYKKLSIVNGCRIGISLYGITNNIKLKLQPTFRVISKVIQINDIKRGTVGYRGTYHVNKATKIAIIPIGYGDGIIRKNTGRYVYINNKAYKIIGDICMDMLFVKVDNKVSIDNKVEIIKDHNHLKYIAKYLDTIPYEVLTEINMRVPRVYK